MNGWVFIGALALIVIGVIVGWAFRNRKPLRNLDDIKFPEYEKQRKTVRDILEKRKKEIDEETDIDLLASRGNDLLRKRRDRKNRSS